MQFIVRRRNHYAHEEKYFPLPVAHLHQSALDWVYVLRNSEHHGIISFVLAPCKTDLQGPAADEVAPRPDLARDALLLGQLLAHALCEEHRGLSFISKAHHTTESGELTFGSINSGTPKSTAFLLIT
jgi:hypothetical protein